MKRFALISIACSACWGAGPTPTAPTGADIIFKIPPTYKSEFCNNERYPYIGDVAIGGGFAYAAEMHFTPPMNNCDGDMGPTNTISKPVRVHRIPLDGAAATVETVGASQGSVTTRVVATPSRGGSVHSVDPGSRLELRGDEVPQQNVNYTGGFYIPVGLVADETHAFAIATTGEPRLSSQEVNSPEYPCCTNSGGTGGSTPGTFGFKLAWNDTTMPPVQISMPGDMYVISDSLKSGVVANNTTVFYAMRPVSGATRDVDLQSMPKTDTLDFTERGGVPEDVGIPVGFAATEDRLAWTVSWSYARLPLPEPRCGLYLLDLMTAGAQQQLHFNSNGDFSCQDLALDGDHAYFMITKVVENERSNNNPADMRAIGIGRVSLTSPAVFESVTIGDGESTFSGPRRIFLHEQDMYLVDPFAIARISKSALDGKSDF